MRCPAPLLLLCWLLSPLAVPVTAQSAPDPVPGWLQSLSEPRTEAGRAAFAAICQAGSQAFLPVVAELNHHLEEQQDRALHGAPRFALPDTLQPNPSDPYQHTLATFEPDPDSLLDLRPGPKDPLEHWLFHQDRGLDPGACRALACVLWLTHQESGAAAALPVLLKLLDHPRRELVEEAARAILAIGPPVARPLSDLLHDRRRGWVAATVLGHLGEAGRRVLEEELAVDDRRTRLRAIFGLGLAAEHGTAETWRLVGRYLGSLDMVLTRLAAWSLSRAGADALPLLLEKLGDDSRQVRAHATCALGLMGPAAAAAIPTIVEHLRTETADVSMWSAEALGRIAPGSPDEATAIATLVEGATDGYQPLRLACLSSLGRFEQSAERVLPVLRRFLDEGDALSRYVALRSVMQLGPAGTEAWPRVRELAFENGLRALREAAVTAMGRMGSSGFGDLVRCLHEPELAGRALLALGEMGSESAGEGFEAMLGDEDPAARRRAAEALAMPAVALLVGERVVPALERALQDPDSEVQKAARLALEHQRHRAP